MDRGPEHRELQELKQMIHFVKEAEARPWHKQLRDPDFDEPEYCEVKTGNPHARIYAKVFTQRPDQIA